MSEWYDMIESRYTYFSHDHDLVARKIKLLIAFPGIISECPLEYTWSRNPRSGDQIKEKSRFNIHWLYQTYWFLHHNLPCESSSKPNHWDTSKQDSYYTYAALMCLIDSSFGKAQFLNVVQIYSQYMQKSSGTERTVCYLSFCHASGEWYFP